MSRVKTLVVGVDFTPCSASALKQAIRIAQRNQATLQVVHVIETLVVVDLEEALSPYQADVRAGLVRDAGKAWTEFTGNLSEASGLELEVEIDHPVVAILRRVQERSADLLVLACRTHAGPFTSVVACVDFSATSRQALEHAVRVATQDGAALHVLHVFHAPWHRLHYGAPTPQASPDYQKQYRDALRRRLEAFCEPFHDELARLEVRYGLFDFPGHGRGITEFARQVGADLVVLGTRGRTNLRDLLLGSTAERVVRDAPCSILTVKPDELEDPASTGPTA